MRQLWRAGRAQASGLGAARKYINETLTKPTAAPSMYREQATVITIVIIGLQYRYCIMIRVRTVCIRILEHTYFREIPVVCAGGGPRGSVA
jgi:hypothetical protein